MHRRLAVTLPRIAALALGLFIAWTGVKIADEYYRLFELAFQPQIRDLGGSDFPAFYGGVELFLEEPSSAYEPDAQGKAIAIAKGRPPDDRGSPWERYYNPPVYSILMWPLTLFDLHTAYGISFLINAAGMGLLLGVLYRLLQSHTGMFLFFAAGLLTSQPVNYAFWHAQPTLFLAALLGFVYLQRDSAKPVWSGLAWAALIVKPHWLVVPLFGQGNFGRKQLVAAAVGALALSLPFALLGVHGTLEYLDLLIGRGTGDVGNESFAEAVLSWPGFFRGLTGDTRFEAGLGMSVLMLIYYLMIRRRANDDTLPLAGAATFLLVVPHSHPQDWIMLVPGAAILLRSHTSAAHVAVTSALLVAVSAGIAQWSGLTDRRNVIYWPTLAGFCLLIWCYVLSELQARPVPLPAVQGVDDPETLSVLQLGSTAGD